MPRAQRDDVEHHVSVRAAHTERAHRATAHPAVARHVPRRGKHLNRRVVPPDVLARRREVQRRRHRAPAQALHQGDHTDQPRRRQRVPQRGLGRNHPQPLLTRPVAQGVYQCVQFHRVAQTRARAVAEQYVERRRINTAVRPRRPQQRRLRLTTRRRDAVGAPVVVRPGCRDLRQRLQAEFPHRLLRRQHHHSHGLCRNHAVRVAGERRTPASFGEHARLTHSHHRLRRQQQVHTRHDRDIRAALANRSRRLVHRHQARRAGRVDRHADTGQVKEVRETRGHDRVRRRRDRRPVRSEALVVACLGPHIHVDPPPH